MIQIVENTNRSGLITVTTVGLPSTIKHPEISIEVNNSELREEAEIFLRYIADYLIQYQKQIRAGETLAYGYWLVKFEQAEADILEIWEQDVVGAEFVKGADLALTYWRDQHQTCSQHAAEFKPPHLNQLTVVSDGVFEGLPIKAVRYPSPDHMSGWWLITSKYDGNIKNLRNEHSFHVTARRPDVARFLALPSGFRFDTDTGNVWLDEEVANATA